jgi:hypothetical protein
MAMGEFVPVGARAASSPVPGLRRQSCVGVNVCSLGAPKIRAAPPGEFRCIRK